MYKILRIDNDVPLIQEFEEKQFFPLLNVSDTFKIYRGDRVVFWSSPKLILHQFLAQIANFLSTYQRVLIFDTSSKLSCSSNISNNIVAVRTNSIQKILAMFEQSANTIDTFIITDISSVTSEKKEHDFSKTSFILRSAFLRMFPYLNKYKNSLVCGNQQRVKIGTFEYRPWGNHLLSIFNQIIKMEQRSIDNRYYLIDFSTEFPNSNFTSILMEKPFKIIIQDSIYQYLLNNGIISKFYHEVIINKTGEKIGTGRIDLSNKILLNKNIIDLLPVWYKNFINFYFGS